MAAEQKDPAPSFVVHACSAPLRVAGAVLQALAALNLLYVAAHLVFDILEGTETAPPPVVALGLSLFSGIPWLAAALIRRFLGARAEIQPPHLLLALRGARFEIPLASIAAIHPLRLPLPGPGFALEMKSGSRFHHRFVLSDPAALLSAMKDEVPAAAGAIGHASFAYARAKHEIARRRWYFWAIKYALFPLVLSVILFRVHQIIVFGGAFGQYRMYGLLPYLRSFGVFWAGLLAELVVYAGVWRLAGEAVALGLAQVLPSRVRGVRRAVEVVCWLAYFGLIPAFLLSRLLF